MQRRSMTGEDLLVVFFAFLGNIVYDVQFLLGSNQTTKEDIVSSCDIVPYTTYSARQAIVRVVVQQEYYYTIHNAIL
jgi:hypothetical protein